MTFKLMKEDRLVTTSDLRFKNVLMAIGFKVVSYQIKSKGSV